MAGFISEWWPESNRNGGRHQIGIPGRIASEFADQPENDNNTAGLYTYFTTELVGILPDGQPSSPLGGFTWADNYHVNDGGVVLFEGDGPINLDGYGGAEILSISGASNVPELSTNVMILLGVVGIGAIGYRSKMRTSWGL